MKRMWGVAMVAALALSTSGGATAGGTSAKRVAELSGRGFEGGDPNATGKAVLRVNPAAGRICFRITFRRLIDPNFGGVYRGSRSTGGSSHVTLFNGDRE